MLQTNSKKRTVLCFVIGPTCVSAPPSSHVGSPMVDGVRYGKYGARDPGLQSCNVCDVIGRL